MSNQWVVLIPDLFWPEPDDEQTLQGLSCPLLEKMLARGCLKPVDGMKAAAGNEPEALLLSLSGAGETLARLRMLGEDHFSDRPGQHWLCADPVHLQFHHEQVVLADPRAFSVSAAEARAWVDDLNQTFPELGIFYAPSPDRWYLQYHQPDLLPPKATLPGLHAVAGRRLSGDAVHRESPDSALRQLRHWQNEIQMWLHAHPLNIQRQSSGKPTINGLWFWGNSTAGSSAMPPCQPSAFTGVVSSHENVLAKGIARFLNLPWQALNELSPGDQWLSGAGPRLIVWDALSQPVLYEEGAEWRKQMQALEQRLLAPLLASGQSFELWVSGIFGLFQWRRADYRAWQFWKTPSSLASTIHRLAARS